MTVEPWRTLRLSEKQDGTLYFNGTIDEVRIWSKSFAPDETVAMKQII